MVVACESPRSDPESWAWKLGLKVELRKLGN